MKNEKVLFVCVVLVVVLFLSIISFASSSNQGSYPDPNKTIEMIIPYSAGGGTDIITRAILKYFDIGAPVVIVDIPGGNSVIGTMEAYHSKPDGYNLFCMGPHSMLAFNISGSLPVPAWKDMESIAIVVKDADIVVVPKNSPFNSMEELITYAKENPGVLSWGTTGTGGSNHITSARIWKSAGIKVNFVPFEGASKSRVAIMGGHVDAVLMQVSEGASLIDSGDLRGLVVTDSKRSKFVPDIPTAIELGYDVEFSLYRAFWAPPNTPKEIVQKLEAEIKRVTEDPEFISEVENKFHYEVEFIGSKEVHEMLLKDEPAFREIIDELVK